MAQRTLINELYFCYDPHDNTTQRIVLTNVQVGGYQASQWNGYVWFLKHPGPGWGDTFANTGGWEKGSYGWKPDAKAWLNKLNISVSNGVVTLTKSGIFPSPHGKTDGNKQWCNLISLCVYKGRGYVDPKTHPCVSVGLCAHNSTIVKTRQSKQAPISRSTATSSPVRSQVYGGTPTPDE